MALLLSGYYCCHLFDVTKYQHKYAEVQHIADTPSVQMRNVWPHSPQVVFKADLHDFIPMVLVETSNSWEILPDIFVHDEPYKIFDLDLTNQVEFYLCSVVYHLPRYKTFLKYGCWLLSFQYCYIRLWVWIQLDEYLSFSWHNMSSFGN